MVYLLGFSCFSFLLVLLALAPGPSNAGKPLDGASYSSPFQHLSSYSAIVTQATQVDPLKTKLFIYELETCSLLEEWFMAEWTNYKSALNVFIVDCPQEMQGDFNFTLKNKVNSSMIDNKLLLLPCLSTESQETSFLQNYSVVMPFSQKYANIFDYPLDKNTAFSNGAYDFMFLVYTVESSIPLISKILKSKAPFHFIENQKITFNKNVSMPDGVYFTAKSPASVPPAFKAISLQNSPYWNVFIGELALYVSCLAE